MLSRVADAIYWMNAYVERAEHIARMLHVNYYLNLECFSLDNTNHWQPLIETTGDDALFAKRFAEATEETVIEFLMFDKNNVNSIYNCLSFARENARSIREIISSEIWEHLNSLYHLIKHVASKSKKEREFSKLLREVVAGSQMFQGLIDTTLMHGQEQHFALLGRLIERADKITRIVDVKYFTLLPEPTDINTPFDSLQWAALLKSTGAFEMYRRKFHRIDVSNVANFLLLEPDFPRSFYYCILRIQRLLSKLVSECGNHAEYVFKTCSKFEQDIQEMNINSIIDIGLHEYIDNIQLRLNMLGKDIKNTFMGAQYDVEVR